MKRKNRITNNNYNNSFFHPFNDDNFQVVRGGTWRWYEMGLFVKNPAIDNGSRLRFVVVPEDVVDSIPELIQAQINIKENKSFQLTFSA